VIKDVVMEEPKKQDIIPVSIYAQISPDDIFDDYSNSEKNEFLVNWHNAH
jgi:hypothetical protein